MIRQIAHNAIDYNKIAYMCLIDLTKFFDRVRLPNVARLQNKKMFTELGAESEMMQCKKISTPNFWYKSCRVIASLLYHLMTSRPKI